MLKIYRIKQMSASILVYPEGKPQRIEFKGGVSRNNFNGQFATENETLQAAIEASPTFGDCVNGQIYISETFGEKKVEVVENKVIEPKEVKEIKEVVKLGFKEVKQLLIEKHGCTPDDVKNFLQVKKKVKDLGLDYEL